MANVHQTIQETGIVPPGYYWVIAPYGNYPIEAVRADPRMQTKATTNEREIGETFALVKVLEPVPLEQWGWLWDRWGHAEKGINTSPYHQGVWVQPGPDFLSHTAYEVIEDIKENLPEIPKIGKGIALWVAGGALAIGVAIFLARRK